MKKINKQQITKRQHYVQQDYLASWSFSNDKVYMLKKHEGKIIVTNPVNVCVVNYCYEIFPINKDEIYYLLDIINDVPKESFYVYNKFPSDLLSVYFGILELKKRESNILTYYKNPFLYTIDTVLFIGASLNYINQDYLDYISEKLQVTKDDILRELTNYGISDLYDYLSKQTMESMMCAFEESFASLKKLEQEGIASLDYEDYQEIIKYASISYFRSIYNLEKIKQIYGNGNIKNINGYNIKSYVIFILAVCFTQTLMTKHPKIILLENKSKINFITSDRPAINILAESDRPPKYFEIFFPLSPSKAILIKELDEKWGFDDKVSSDNEYISQFNDKIYKMSCDYLIANNSEILQDYRY